MARGQRVRVRIALKPTCVQRTRHRDLWQRLEDGFENTSKESYQDRTGLERTAWTALNLPRDTDVRIDPPEV